MKTLLWVLAFWAVCGLLVWVGAAVIKRYLLRPIKRMLINAYVEHRISEQTVRFWFCVLPLKGV